MASSSRFPATSARALSAFEAAASPSAPAALTSTASSGTGWARDSCALRVCARARSVVEVKGCRPLSRRRAFKWSWPVSASACARSAVLLMSSIPSLACTALASLVVQLGLAVRSSFFSSRDCFFCCCSADKTGSGASMRLPNCSSVLSGSLPASSFVSPRAAKLKKRSVPSFAVGHSVSAVTDCSDLASSGSSGWGSGATSSSVSATAAAGPSTSAAAG
mmetsp:Transcript_103511/g.288214  ORF Transcript_103511/g.288214 Transcript_103511/m.288214 type:complete len:220 (+) Transcript_103511:432-1091(+)